MFEVKLAGYLIIIRDAGGGGEGNCPSQFFGTSVNPIPTKGADYAHHITTSPPPLRIFRPSALKSNQVCKRST